MPNPIVECIPNFSEARRPEVIDAISDAIRSVTGVAVLDRHSDLDHNRTVITFAGAPPAVEEAAFQAIATAASHINLDHHTGEHPRIGATDVVPFVPIQDVSMQDCVEMARRVGRRVGEQLEIPVYLYEEAAARPERRNLEDIRRGEYETLKQQMGENPERDPDFGPVKVGPAGATVIGARYPLIAFNVYLTTNDVSIARKIARSVRFSSGGLRYVKALGLMVEGQAQVSMNLTNFRQTSLARVVEFIRREAQRYGVGILSSELVGLIPQEALVDAAVWYTQMDMFHPEQVLENRLHAAAANFSVPEKPVETSFVEALAQGTPTPGGGSAAAHGGSVAAALVAMVARLTSGKKKYADVEERMRQIAKEADALRAALTAAVQEDSKSFEQYIAALRMPKETGQQQQERAAALEAATHQTILVPLRVTNAALQVLRLAVELVRKGNINAISDAASGAALARAAINSSSLNVRMNCSNLQDKAAAAEYTSAVSHAQVEAQSLEQELQVLLRERGNLSG